MSHLEEEVRSLEEANAEATKLNVEVQQLSGEVRAAHTKCKENEGMLEEIAEENEQLELLADKRSPYVDRNLYAAMPCAREAMSRHFDERE